MKSRILRSSASALRLILGLVIAIRLYFRGVIRALRQLSGPTAFDVITHPERARFFAEMPAIAGGDGTDESGLEAERQAVRDALESMEAAHRSLQDAGDDADNLDELRTAFDDAERDHHVAAERLRRAESVAEARSAAPAQPVSDPEPGDGGGDGGDVRVSDEPLTYRRGGEHSFFADMYLARMQDDPAARERLQDHQREARVEFERRAAAEGRALSTGATAGGEFVPPVWMNEDFIRLARNGRPFANAVRNMPLPGNTNTINIPSVATGSATAPQSDNAAVQSTDPTTGSIAVPVRTVAGQVDTSRQLVDRAVPGVDEIIFADLLDDYATKIDVQTISGSGAAPNATGVLQTANIEAVAYTDATPTIGELFVKLADAVQRVATLRKKPAEVIVMAPRRWAWAVSQVDANGRPLVVPAAGAFNPLGVATASQGADVSQDATGPTFVGMMLGLPVMVDPNIPVNLGAGTNEDIIIVTRLSDLYLFENDEPNQATYFEVLSGNLGVRFQVYGYFAFTAARYPKATATVGGTGLITPTF